MFLLQLESLQSWRFFISELLFFAAKSTYSCAAFWTLIPILNRQLAALGKAWQPCRVLRNSSYLQVLELQGSPSEVRIWYSCVFQLTLLGENDSHKFFTLGCPSRTRWLHLVSCSRTLFLPNTSTEWNHPHSLLLVFSSRQSVDRLIRGSR